MNKAFVREPEADTRVLCPRCGTAGAAVGSGPLDTHVRPEFRGRLQDHAWYCGQTTCDVAYFNQIGTLVLLHELRTGVYPYDIDAPICACFGLTWDDVDADVRDGTPIRIRQLLARSQSPEARCHIVAPDGQCCMREVQRLYLKRRNEHR